MAGFSRTLKNVRITESSFAYGGLADLHKGQWSNQSIGTVTVAIKVIRRSTWNDEVSAKRARRRFLREAGLLSQLNHPNVVPLYGVVFERDFPGLVMPYYKNGDLSRFLRRHPQANKLKLIIDIATGLEYLHNLKPNAVIHGDIKATNILVTDDHRACLADFGVSRMLAVSGYTTTGMNGTYRWMSPELVKEEERSPTTASDIWAFGMTILEIYTGKLPFENFQRDVTVIWNLIIGELPQQPPEVSGTMWGLLKSCWERNPTERPCATALSLLLYDMVS